MLASSRTIGAEHFITSDLHLGHVNISAYSGRPFSDVDSMNEWIITTWNETVRPNDLVDLVGDLAMGQISETLPLIGQLHGYKRLYPGNHDRCHPHHGKKAEGWDERYRIEGRIAEIHYGVCRVKFGTRRSVLVCHFPYSGDSRKTDRFPEFRPEDTGEQLVHGHVHHSWRVNGRMVNVGLDAWGGRILPVDELVATLDAGPADLSRIEWPEL